MDTFSALEALFAHSEFDFDITIVPTRRGGSIEVHGDPAVLVPQLLSLFLNAGPDITEAQRVAITNTLHEMDIGKDRITLRG